jgi:DNA polymerase-3 subunit gamma/tau
MSYVVLARKWRPKQFSELVGQEHVLRALANALDSGRVHHAFLFSGTRGVGKTTIARILAKSLNCETGVSSRPCGTCAACREIDEGRFVDLIEVDAASRTKVDDTRELLDNVQYSPARGRYKVYLIDEVHMLSNHSFNALLKTLEEPPPHVKFLLATTDPQKLPVTVLSRCLQFNLKRLPAAMIRSRLEEIARAENLAFEPASLELLARAADGSLRDALSLLDQLIAFGGGKLGEQDARAMLGTIDRAHTVRLLELIAAQDAQGLLAEVAAQAEFAPDYAAALDELAGLLQKVALRQALPTYDAGELFSSETLDALAARISAEDLQLYYQIAIVGRRDLDLAPDPRGGFEMVLLRMLAFRPASAARIQDSNAARPAAQPARARSAAPATAAAAPQPAEFTAENWPGIISALDVQGATRQLAANCLPLERSGTVLRLLLDQRGAHYRTRQTEDLLAAALGRLAGGELRLQIEVGESAADTPARQQARVNEERLQNARRELENDPTVRALQEKFGATVVPDSVKPLN